jgi:hypothetical protein
MAGRACKPAATTRGRDLSHPCHQRDNLSPQKDAGSVFPDVLRAVFFPFSYEPA